jgi:predicted DNA-binding transcriptional regulator YafY
MTLRPIPRPKVARVGRAKGKFTQSRRLDVLRSLLEGHPSGLTLEQMAESLHVSTRSVRRYLHELGLMTDVESLEVGPGEQNLWRIKPSERGRAVTLRRAQAYGLLAPRRVFEVLRGSALFDEIDLALRQVEQVAHRPAARIGVRGDVPAESRLEDRFAYVPPAPRAHRSEDVDGAFLAVAESTVLRFRYREEGTEAREGREAREGKGARITAHPYALVLHDGNVTCIAYDVDRAVTRAFALGAMSDVVASEAEHFEQPPTSRSTPGCTARSAWRRPPAPSRSWSSSSPAPPMPSGAERSTPRSASPLRATGASGLRSPCLTTPGSWPPFAPGSWASGLRPASSSRASWPTRSRASSAVRLDAMRKEAERRPTLPGLAPHGKSTGPSHDLPSAPRRQQRRPAHRRQEAPGRPVHARHRTLRRGPFWQKIPAYRSVDEATFLDHNWQAKNSITKVAKLVETIQGSSPPGSSRTSRRA